MGGSGSGYVTTDNDNRDIRALEEAKAAILATGNTSGAAFIQDTINRIGGLPSVIMLNSWDEIWGKYGLR